MELVRVPGLTRATAKLVSRPALPRILSAAGGGGGAELWLPLVVANFRPYGRVISSRKNCFGSSPTGTAERTFTVSVPLRLSMG